MKLQGGTNLTHLWALTALTLGLLEALHVARLQQMLCLLRVAHHRSKIGAEHLVDELSCAGRQHLAKALALAAVRAGLFLDKEGTMKLIRSFFSYSG